MENVLITGANSGIGRATAVRLAASGYGVYAAMRDLGKSEKLLALAEKAGVSVVPIELDVTDGASVSRASDRIARDGDPIDILINNAGIAYNATTEDISVEDAKVVFDTNYWGAIRCIQAVLPAMRERGTGHIVNISSVAGRIAAIAQGVYSASKWALECLSENLVQEVSPFGIRVTVIEPGVARTAILPKNVGHPEPTVYETAYRRMDQFYIRGAIANASAEHVAETIADAIADPDPRFRYTCAWGGEELPRGRAQMSDAEWIELGNAPDDEGYYERFERLFGMDLRIPD